MVLYEPNLWPKHLPRAPLIYSGDSEKCRRKSNIRRADFLHTRGVRLVIRSGFAVRCCASSTTTSSNLVRQRIKEEHIFAL
jgi:hypothetical protein